MVHNAFEIPLNSLNDFIVSYEFHIPTNLIQKLKEIHFSLQETIKKNELCLENKENVIKNNDDNGGFLKEEFENNFNKISKEKENLENNLLQNSINNKNDSMIELRTLLAKMYLVTKSMLGYEITFNENNVILHSSYAFDDEDIFVFEIDDNNSCTLKSNEFVANWKREIDLYLLNGKSVPAFLSAVTLELYNQKTYG
ncbi:putative mitotic checkpoint protein [Hamiltosporidium tvaerminnensis]|uniref:Spindle assembly checkpoint component MAD1 n=1 Tax=Hamiltosporidium tvaerminnensis TaxID=1176355 RepID=A0A4Q9KYX2_9MICR|nr:Mitotic spindle assembly checkpoint protein MAD1 [Hamiltosporidium tvaerminnensis]TBU00217.1 putative mitotic checkpoint protein [Hamiltosporidium tvaerminnensis]